MAKEFLGSGWTFPIRINDRGGVALSRDDDKIRESIMIILSTAKGERVMRPEFGCDIHDFTFASMSSSTMTMVRSAVREALVLWEPRIEVMDVRASTENMKDGILLINVEYRIRRTNTEFNIVYPFYLKPGG